MLPSALASAKRLSQGNIFYGKENGLRLCTSRLSRELHFSISKDYDSEFRITEKFEILFEIADFENFDTNYKQNFF